MVSCRSVCGCLLAIALVLGGAGGMEAAAQTGTIDGSVVDSETGEAVPGAVITVEGTSIRATANVVGRFRLTGVPAGTADILIEAAGFLPLRAPGTEIAAGAPTELAVELVRTPNLLERVQVTATKVATSVGDLAVPVTILDRESMDRRGDLELTNALENVPGVKISGQLGPFESILMRGMPRSGNENETTLLMIDGIPQTDSRNSARVINLPIHDASSIEIIRGPNSALYGRTAIGGSVNVLTANLTLTPEFSVDLVGGSFGTLKAVATASGPISDWGGYYLSTSGNRDHGYYKNDVDFATDESSHFTKLTFIPDERSFGSITFNRVTSDNSLPSNEPVVVDPGTGELGLLHEVDPDFARLTNLNFPDTYHQEETRVTFNYIRQLSERVSLTELFGYRRIQYKFIDDLSFVGAPFDVASQNLTLYGFEQQADEDIFYQELRFNITPDLGEIPNNLIVGWSYEDTSGFVLGNFIFSDPDTFGFPINYANPVIPGRDQWQFFEFGGRDYDLGSHGLFVQYTVEPGRFIFSGGGRYDYLALDNIRTLEAGQPEINETFKAFSPKASVTFKVLGADGTGPSVNVYGAYSEAFRPPRVPSGLSVMPDEEQLDPEDIQNFEFGLKASVLNDRLALEGGFFWMDRDGIVISIREGAFFRDANAGTHKNKGLELGATLAATDEVTVWANAAFYRNTFGDLVIEQAGGVTDLTGNRLNMSPEYLVNWGVLYSPTPVVDVTLDVKHVSDVFVDIRNDFVFDPYTLVGAAVSWQVGLARLTVSGTNLFDEEYYWGGSTSFAETADPGRPRQILLTTSFTFGP